VLQRACAGRPRVKTEEKDAMRGRALLATAVVVVLTPASAEAATTIGSDLGRASDTPGWCVGDGPGEGCTYLQLSLGTADQVIRSDGVITRWATRDARGDLTLVVIDGPAGQRRVVGRAATVQGSGSGLQTFNVQIPVRAGQRIGIEVGANGAVPFLYLDEQTTGERYRPPLTDTPSAPDPESAVARTYEILYNATLEADADRDGLGDETQDPDRGGAGSTGTGSCPTSGVLARGAGSVVFRTGARVYGCRDGARTLLGRRSRTSQFRLFKFNTDKLALVRVRDGRSFVEAFDLDDKRRIFSTPRTSSGGPPTSWRVTDLVIAPDGKAAWIARVTGVAATTTVWVRNRTRVQEIDQGRIRPTSLQLASDASGINYIGADGSARNSGF
jgi:hypothetical protein